MTEREKASYTLSAQAWHCRGSGRKSTLISEDGQIQVGRYCSASVCALGAHAHGRLSYECARPLF